MMWNVFACQGWSILGPSPSTDDPNDGWSGWMSGNALTNAIKRLALHAPLDAEALRRAFGEIMRGEGTPAQVAGLLMALRVKGETADEVAGVVQALRDAMVVLPATPPKRSWIPAGLAAVR